MGADIVAGEGQSFGNALNFGGPHLGLFATRERYVRHMPGRLVGETVDAEGRRGWVLTLSTREQHIRREKATSNICTNSGLGALAFTIHLSLLGEAGLTRLAKLNHATAVTAAERLAKIPGVKGVNNSFFNEFALRLPKPAPPVGGPVVPGAASSPTCCWSPRPKPSPPTISNDSRPGSRTCCDERVEPGPKRASISGEIGRAHV